MSAPFIPWLGGKRRLADRLMHTQPSSQSTVDNIRVSFVLAGGERTGKREPGKRDEGFAVHSPGCRSEAW
jgi:hypothetical protein